MTGISGAVPAAEQGPHDRYRLDTRIATGGMGEVWRATDLVLDREVAVKVLKHEYADDPTFVARFEAEARHAAALHHQNIASVFDFGELADGSDRPRPFLVMELVPGQPLSMLLGGEPMPPANAAELVAQAADAISAAHALGIVHRDVKPANLLVTPDGQVKITDFGIARAADAVPLTQTGQIVGTPHYISPEQVEGQPATAASDIYALGVVLYECLAGRRPFAADTPVTTALAHLREPVPPLPDSVPEHLQAVVATAQANDPADRFASAGDLADALRGSPVNRPVPAGPATQLLTLPATPVTADDGRGVALPGWPWLAAAASVLLVVAGFALFTGDEPTSTAAGDQAVQTGAEPPQDDRLRVRRGALVGMEFKQAKERLEDRGFKVEEEKRPATSPDQRKDTVAAVRPAGLVAPGTSITLVVWEEYKPAETGDDSEESENSEEESEGSGDEGSGEDDPGHGEDKSGDEGKGEKGPSDTGEKHGNPKGNQER